MLTFEQAMADVRVAEVPCCDRLPIFKLGEDEALVQVTEAVQGGESNAKDDDFLKHELILAALIYWLWTNAQEAYGLEEKLTEAAKSNHPSNVSVALDAGQHHLDGIVDEKEQKSIGTKIEDAIIAGAAILGISAETIRGLRSVANLRNGMTGQVSYYANNYIRRVVTPHMMRAIQAQTSNPSAPVDLLSAIQGGLTTQVKKNATYWRIVANQAQGRANHYGILRAAQNRGVLGYRLVAILDHRTSALCRRLHGREFWVADGLDHLERVASVSPEQVPIVAPWVKADEVKGKSAAELRSLGVLVPPFHAHCRTTLKPIHK